MTINPFTSTDIQFALRVFSQLDGSATRYLQGLIGADCYIDSQEADGDTIVLGDFYVRRHIGKTESVLGSSDCIEYVVGEPVFVPGNRDEPDDTDIIEKITVSSWTAALLAIIEVVAVDHYRNLIEAEALADSFTEPVQEPDIFHCPECGGPADNGHDRCFPPNPYFCTKCMEKLEKNT